jgi:hypothetical protein
MNSLIAGLGTDVILVNKLKISSHSKSYGEWSKGVWEAMLENIKKDIRFYWGIA